MTSLPLTITRSAKSRRKILVELDADRFERLASGLGLFNPSFLASLHRAEQEVAEGKARELQSLKDLRKKR